MSSGIYLPEIEVFSQLDPSQFEDFYTTFQADFRVTDGAPYVSEVESGTASGHELVLMKNAALVAAEVILQPVHEDLHAHLGLSSGDSVMHSGLSFDRHTALPGQPYLDFAMGWHTDGSTPGEVDVRVDSKDGSEILQGEIPQELLDDLEQKTGFIFTTGDDAEIETFAKEFEPIYRYYDDETLIRLGLSWAQPIAGAAYILRGTHIHRSPVNRSSRPRTRSSLSSTYTAVRG